AHRIVGRNRTIEEGESFVRAGAKLAQALERPGTLPERQHLTFLGGEVYLGGYGLKHDEIGSFTYFLLSATMILQPSPYNSPCPCRIYQTYLPGAERRTVS